MTRFNTGNPVGSTDPRDRHDNSQAFDQAINSDQTEFQDRLGKRRLTVQGMVDAATTGNPAVGAAQEALESAGRAEEEADRAEVAAEAAITNGQIYTTVGAGEAATVDGDYFWVVSESDETVLELWLRGASSATDTGKRTIALGEGVDRISPSTKNLFNPASVEYGYWYDNNGNASFNPAQATTPKMDVGAATHLTVSGLPATWVTNAYKVRFFDATDVYLGEVAPPNSVANFATRYFVAEVPTGTATYAISLEAANIPAALQIEAGAAVTEYEPYALLKHGVNAALIPKITTDRVSPKNIFTGQIAKRFSLNDEILNLTSSDDDVVTAFIPVETGKTYTISGLNPALMGNSLDRRVIGFGSDQQRSILNPATEVFPDYSSNTYTFTVGNINTKFIVVQLSKEGVGTYADAAALRIQVEEGTEATEYDPYRPAIGVRDAVRLAKDYTDKELAEATGAEDWLLDLQNVQSFDFLNCANSFYPIMSVSEATRAPGPHGIRQTIQGSGEASSNNLAFKFTAKQSAELAVYANILSVDNAGETNTPAARTIPFEVPSGQADNPGTLGSYAEHYPLSNYTHPSIAYDSAGVAGYKYWMISSFYPLKNQGGAIWEDEDLFVSNDGENWQRVQSLYEDAKSYTAPTLRLPPSDAATDARRNAFLPTFAVGDTLEISSPAHNGNPAVDRQTVTLGSALPFKHDPAIFIDDGYVYTYHSFHLPYNDSGQGAHRFMVCVRTADGVNWEAVRSDGSVLALDSEAAVRQMFTKDASGRYNYLNYAYSTNRTNPEIIKYGAGDYELLYGFNFSQRFSGTTPYNFDFNNPLPCNIDSGNSGNHPGAIYDGENLYVVNNRGLHVSSDRGATSTKLPHHPLWAGGLTGAQYKKALVVGDGGKLLVIDVFRPEIPTVDELSEGSSAAINRQHHQFSMVFDSLSDFLSIAQNGLQEGYIDVQISRINKPLSERRCSVYNWIGCTSEPLNLNSNHQKVKITDISVKRGDEVHIWVTLTARNAGSIRFNGLQVERQQ